MPVSMGVAGLRPKCLSACCVLAAFLLPAHRCLCALPIHRGTPDGDLGQQMQQMEQQMRSMLEAFGGGFGGDGGGGLFGGVPMLPPAAQIPRRQQLPEASKVPQKPPSSHSDYL